MMEQYTLTINADDDDNGTEILLTLRGEQFLHVIDLDTFRMTADNRMTQDLQLSQSPPMPGFGGGAGCCLLLFALVFVSTLLKTVAGWQPLGVGQRFRGSENLIITNVLNATLQLFNINWLCISLPNMTTIPLRLGKRQVWYYENLGSLEKTRPSTYSISPKLEVRQRTRG
jgi:hypothetical protein